MPSAIQQIRELRALHEEGLLNAQEFTRRKNTILDSVFALSKSASQDTTNAGGDNSPPTPDHTAPQVIRSTTDLGYLIGQHVQASGKEYRLEKLVGQGGMGQVWQVHDLSTEAELGYSEALALKIISPEWCASAAHRRLLIEEANLVRKLAHDNIVRVYDWGRDPATGSVFIVMEYLEGQDIESYLRQQLSKAGPGIQGLSLKHALKILRPVANALHYAWNKQGLVHRDLKPSNIFLCKNGSIKLLDFGIAARFESMHVNGGMAAPQSGTIGYRAPETSLPHHTYHPTADVYAMASMLYFLLEGQVPLQDRNQTSTLKQPRALQSAQWQLLLQGLSPDPNQRQANPLTLIHALSMTLVEAHNGPQPSWHEVDLRTQQRQQRKAEEQRRRQQASQALHYLQSLVNTTSEKNGMVTSKRIASSNINSHQNAGSWDQARNYLGTVSHMTETNDINSGHRLAYIHPPQKLD